MSFNPNDIEVDDLLPLNVRPDSSPAPAASSSTSGVSSPDTLPTGTPAPAPAVADSPKAQPVLAVTAPLAAPAASVEAAPVKTTAVARTAITEAPTAVVNTADTAADTTDKVAGDPVGDEQQAQIARFARRRRRYQTLGLAIAAVIVWHIAPWKDLTSSSGSTGATHSARQAGKPAVDAVAADMAKVHAQLTKTGDLTDFKLPGARVAAAGTTLYASRAVQGACVVYGVVKGRDIVTSADTTGQACTDAQIAAVQTELDNADKAARQAAVDSATTALETAANTAVYYAQQNFVAGQPSFTGLPVSSLGGARVVSNQGSWVKLEATSGTTCRTAIVSATGQLGEVSGC